MNLLLDTHAFLWWLAGSSRLGRRALTSIADPGVMVFVSAASVWEAAVKSRLGRLPLDGIDLVAQIADNEFDELPITASHAQRAATLPVHHRDPFDRILVAQALSEELRLVSRDAIFGRYGVETLW